MLLMSLIGFIFSVIASLLQPAEKAKQPQAMMQSLMENQMDKLMKKIENGNLSNDALEKAQSEVEKLYYMDFYSPEAAEIRKYLGILLDIPWNTFSDISVDLKKARQILDDDHYGLEEIKEKIMDYLAVQKRVGNNKAPILCFVGPPGVGKTSLAKSIAKALGREFQRLALGGIHDEALLRGHMRTYIGARPGRIIEALKKAKTSDPVVLLDELDKVNGANHMGDPTAALLEILDPEQNNTFTDHYLEIPYDLSKVLFIATANDLSKLPRPLLDRLEIIEVSGYTEEEKIEIAKRHIIPKQIKQNGLRKNEFVVEEDTLPLVIDYYTREAGIRNLERAITQICRKVAKELSDDDQKTVHLTKSNLEKYAGVRRFIRSDIEQENQIGMVTGLAWTEVGGECLSIEVLTMPGKGEFKCTGRLGEVMTESINAAASYARAHAHELGIQPEMLDKTNFHVHVPEGATPKDGPSAGIAMVTAIVSALSKKPVHHNVAMTGEVTLSGKVLPIGGLKEKLLAAKRAGMKTIIIPQKNEKDLKEIPEGNKQGLNIMLVNDVRQVLKSALVQ